MNWWIGGHAGAHQNVMAGVSKYNVLCGEYTITVKTPENMPPPAHRTDPAPSHPTPTQGCWELNELGDHGPVREKQVRTGAKIFCESDGKVSRKHSWVSREFAPDNRWGDEPLGQLETWFTFSATLDTDECDGSDGETNVQETEGLTSCEDLLVNNYKNCDNGGTGGYIKDGCVTYMFWPYSGPTDGDVTSPNRKITGFG